MLASRSPVVSGLTSAIARAFSRSTPATISTTNPASAAVPMPISRPLRNSTVRPSVSETVANVAAALSARNRRWRWRM